MIRKQIGLNGKMKLNDKLKETQKEASDEYKAPRPPKLLSGTGAVLSSTKGAFDEAQSIKGNIEYLKGEGNMVEGAAGEREAGGVKAGSELVGSSAKVGKKGLEEGMKMTAKKILGGGKVKDIGDIAKMGVKAGKLGELAGVAGGVAGVAGFGANVISEVSQLSKTKTGRGFEGVGAKAGRVGSLAAGAGATASILGTAIAGASSVAATNFWNPLGWVAAGVGVLATGVNLLSNKSTLRRR